MKKILFVLVMVLTGISFFYTPKAYADAGPKPSINIWAKNMPDKLCYMDLLVEGESFGGDSTGFDDPKYNHKLVAQLRDYHEEGMRTLLVNGLSRTYGDIICNVKKGECRLNYTYRVPDRFKIIVVSEDGTMKVSNLIERKSFDSIIRFDYADAKAYEMPFIIAFVDSFLFTALITIILEGLVLFLFRFNIKENIKALLIINIATQVFLYIMISLGMMVLGVLFAMFFYLIAEIIIFVSEALIFAKLLKQHSRLRRVICSITSNLVSFLAGVLCILIQIVRS